MNIKYDQMEVHKLYQQAASHTQSSLYGQALYDLAWSEYNIGNPKEAIATINQLLEYTQSNAEKHQMLIETALKDGLRIAKELDRPSLMKPAFEQSGSMEYYNKQASP